MVQLGTITEGPCVVTFDSYTDDRTLDRPGFGEAFLAARGIPAIHVLTRDNGWYQDPELRPALDLVRAAVAGSRRVVAYGSSMGAYAVLRFGGWAGAGCAMALSPQFSIDPAVMLFERRWAGSSARFRPVWEGRVPFATPAEAYVLFDPLDADARHVARLGRECRFQSVALPGAGHPVGAFLAELGLLQRMIPDLCERALDVSALLTEAMRRREESATYFMMQAKRSPLVSQRIRLLERALACSPGHTIALDRLGTQLGRAGRFAEAAERHEQALANEPGQPLLLLHYSHTLQRAGDLNGALSLMEQSLPRVGGTPAYVERVERLRRMRAGGWRGLLARMGTL